MNIRDLNYILAVAETGNFSKAADICYVSQPTLSGQIKKLEEELGVIIFERTNRKVEITAVGDEILSHARQIISETETIRNLARNYQDPLAGPLKIGAIPTVSPYVMPLVLEPIKTKYPQMRLVLSEERTEQLIGRLKHHEIDAALLATETLEPEFESTELFKEPFWVAYPTKHRFYEMESVTTEELLKESLLLLAKGHCLADQARSICSLAGKDPKSDMADLRASSLETLIQLVGAGYGVTLLPALAMSGSWTSGSGVIAQPLADQNAYRHISLVYRKSFPRPQALAALGNIILERLPNTVQPLTAPL